LFEVYCETFPDDTLSILCVRGSRLEELAVYDNVRVQSFAESWDRELRRLIWALTPGGRSTNGEPVDIIVSVNTGKYVQPDVPQVILLNNAYQVYPWEAIRSHTANVANLAALRWFFRRSLAKASGVVVQTGLMARYVRELAPQSFPVGIVSKAVDRFPHPPSTQPDTLSPVPDRDAFTFFYAATVSPAKNHRTIFSAVALLRERGVPCRLVVTIDPRDAARTGGPATVKLMEEGLIRAAGWVEPGQLPRAYAEADACVMPSLLESQSSAYLEAMQWGKPQIVADFPHARDACGAAAIYASPEDPEDWALKMESLATNPGLQQSLVEAGFHVMEEYPPTWSVAAGRMRAFLASVLMQADTGMANQTCTHS
jgi:glycosyltransferase involved in cell wall biosynthesis